ncbi:DNA methyltransferase [Planktothrix agardhii]|uniref:DNA methyltransferase n=1 Tax=Planktothrix agardhii TaxID=1160 RepID=UPI002B1E9CC6|nr:DNA methyltransferase [Planktothrix agardhii]MEA5559924.1 DNA methyltransferase [Planktothrix agardhii UHCC 0887]
MVNQLYYGDNLEVLRRYIKSESVDLCYIDPPFNSKRNYNQIYNNIGSEDKAQAQAFIDTWEWDDHAIHGIEEIITNYNGKFTHQCIALIIGLKNVLGTGSLLAYLVSMTLRITEIHRILKPTGSFYLHCDPNASHYLKLVLDAVFCSQGGDYKNEIIWKRRTNTIKAITKSFSTLNDIIYFYVKSSKQYYFDIQYEDYPSEYLKRFKYQDEYGRYRWQVMATYSQERLEQLKKENKVRFSPTAKNPEFKQYLHELKGIPITNLWMDIDMINSQSNERLGYPTQKPESLLERIIKASSNENDIVLDAYCGCGTTVAVCQRLDRKWIGIDITYQSISLILKRLEDSFGKEVLQTIKLHGIPKDMESARELANKADDRTRKEFEKWAILTYTDNKGIIKTKKGADQGVDGIAYFQGDQNDPEKIIFQVKSGKVKSGDIRDLIGTMTIENASIAIFITLENPTKDMMKTAKTAGFYQSKYMSQSCDKIQLVTVQDIIENQKRLNIRLSLEVLKSAEKQKEVKVNQMELDLDI